MLVQKKAHKYLYDSSTSVFLESHYLSHLNEKNKKESQKLICFVLITFRSKQKKKSIKNKRKTF